MSPNKHQQNDGNIADWIKELQKHNHSFAKELCDDRLIGFNNLEKLGLPRYKRITLSLHNFMNDPSDVIDKIGSIKFYISLIPATDKLRRFGTSGLFADEVVPYIQGNIKRASYEQYLIVVHEYYDNCYGGNIVVGKDGNVYAEFHRGKQGRIAKGKVTPEYYAWSDNYTGSIKYSFADPELRSAIYRTIKAIPRRDGENRKLVSGYYEFAIVKKDGDNDLEPIFIDAKKSPYYLLGTNMNNSHNF